MLIKQQHRGVTTLNYYFEFEVKYCIRGQTRPASHPREDGLVGNIPIKILLLDAVESMLRMQWEIKNVEF